MTKSELIERLADKHTGLSAMDASRIVDCILDCLQQGIIQGDRVDIRGFGAFTLRLRPSRQRHNLLTKKIEICPPYHTVHFMPYDDLCTRINADGVIVRKKRRPVSTRRKKS
jgi:integration host factor subunit beta